MTSFPVHAQSTRPNGTADFGLRVGAGYSDNLFRSSTNPQTARYDRAGFRFDYFRTSRRFNADILGDVERRKYSIENIPDENVGSAALALDIGVIPETFRWIVSDSYGQGRRNQLQAVGPMNRQTINVFSTGPRINLPLGGRTDLRTSATKSESRFQNSTRLDNEATSYEVWVTRNVSSVTDVGIGVTNTDIEFDDSPIDNEIRMVFLSYQRQLSMGSTSVRAGRTSSTVAGIENGGPSFEIAWNRRIATRSNLNLSARRGITYITNAFLRSNAVGAAGPLPEDLVLVRNNYEFKRLDIGYSLTLPRSDISLSVGAGESRYLQAVQSSNDFTNAGFNFSRTITPQLQMRISTRAVERAYLGTDGRLTNRVSSLRFTKAFARRFSLGFSVFKESQSAQSAFSFDENAAQIDIDIDLNP